MKLTEICSTNRLIDLFVELAEIPSPSLREEKVANKILEIFSIYGIIAQKDKYGNILAHIPPTSDCKDVEPILLCAHMDVVGGLENVNVRLSEDGTYIETDKKRTLGADNKAGVAAVLSLAISFNSLDAVSHGPLEIAFTRDEEFGMSGIENLDTSKFKAKYAIVADGEKLGELDVAGASISQVFITIKGGKGGHSGIDIDDNTRINAIKVLSEIDSQIPQGVFKKDEKGVVTSINAASCCGGSLPAYLAQIFADTTSIGRISENFLPENIEKTLLTQPAFNIIASSSQLSYSIRSSEPEDEQKLIRLIKNTCNEVQKKYGKLIDIYCDVKQHIPPFVESQDKKLVNAAIRAGEQIGLSINPLTFHAGAETHILSNFKQNAKGEAFQPLLVGLANIYNMHSNDEKIDWQSYLKGREWLEQIIVQFASK